MNENSIGGHGGARANAGRKPLLDWFQRWQVGVECEAAYQRAIAEELERQKRELFEEQSELSTLSSQINAVPVSERKRWRRYGRSAAFQQHRQDLKEELRAINPPLDKRRWPARGIRFVVEKLPKGTIRQIRKAVADNWTQQLGVNISESTVRDCWKQFRIDDRQAKEELEQEAQESSQT